jgi:hypothetical protein
MANEIRSIGAMVKINERNTDSPSNVLIL